MNTLRTLLLLFVFSISSSLQGQPATVGEALPPWEEGMLDLHHINTGMGDAAFYIFPDGTTMMVDAGEMDPFGSRAGTARNTKAHPDDSKPPHEWIVAYVKNFMPIDREAQLDYAMITHFHSDHFGVINKESPISKSGKYKLTGITGVGEYLPIRLLLDRGYPKYDYPIDYLGVEGKQIQAFDLRYQLWFDNFKNYLNFIEYQKEQGRLDAAALKAGSKSQIQLKFKADQYPNFEVRNIKSNGLFWTGLGEETYSYFPDFSNTDIKKRPSENPCSNVIRIRYGKFDYFTGGDMPGNADLGAPWWKDVETPAAKAAGPVDVTTLNHHGNQDAMNEYFVQTTQPRVYVHQNWSSDHPGHQVLRRMTSTYLYPGPRDLFALNMLQANKDVIGGSLEQAYKSMEGHILVRVMPGGDNYYVIILDDNTDQYLVTAVHGPYESTDKPYFPKGQMYLIAHRGGIVEGKYAENTAPALKAAIDRGYYMVEMDLRESKDGEIVLHHDNNLQRFYGDERRIEEMTWEEISQLRAQPGNSQPLRLEDAVKICRNRMQIMVDTKGETHPLAFYQKMETLLKENDLLNRALIIGSKENREYFVGKAKVGVKIDFLKEAVNRGEDVANLYFLFMHGNELTPEMVAYAEKYGVLVVPSINVFHYKNEDHMKGAKRDVAWLKKEGVSYFQIDSEYDPWLLNKEYITTR